jgi:hypothetical protein
MPKSAALGQGTKSLRSSPLRGGCEPRGCEPIERTEIARWEGQHDQPGALLTRNAEPTAGQYPMRRATLTAPITQSQSTDNAITKSLDESGNQFA